MTREDGAMDRQSWWRGWLDPRDVDSWLQLFLGLAVLALVVVAIVVGVHR